MHTAVEEVGSRKERYFTESSQYSTKNEKALSCLQVGKRRNKEKLISLWYWNPAIQCSGKQKKGTSRIDQIRPPWKRWPTGLEASKQNQTFNMFLPFKDEESKK